MDLGFWTRLVEACRSMMWAVGLPAAEGLRTLPLGGRATSLELSPFRNCVIYWGRSAPRFLIGWRAPSLGCCGRRRRVGWV
ncbi:hypothetical protein ODS41_08895 [Pyrobaculum sp. 3827-6]|uniref:hypothetical protein n=1 Tax=Pyrobaculum sp. 3827-6 TaxID=2983604 RepID=UPI0021DAA1D7|nr:hypothetical protein [Pyrobaculum sp. 3827-6]MCU7788026.1 hypothetical protein [Pyrobaculum sp. 3827-6]